MKRKVVGVMRRQKSAKVNKRNGKRDNNDNGKKDCKGKNLSRTRSMRKVSSIRG